MNASKENARKARDYVPHTLPSPDREFLIEFLDAAERKLPTEAAYAADKKRSKAAPPQHRKTAKK